MSSYGQGSTRAQRRARAAVLDRDGHACQLRIAGVCTGKATQAHHVHGLQGRPRAAATDPDEQVAVCGPCHRMVTEQQRRAAITAQAAVRAQKRARRGSYPAGSHPGD
jgi:hypothetical protein